MIRRLVLASNIFGLICLIPGFSGAVELSIDSQIVEGYGTKPAVVNQINASPAQIEMKLRQQSELTSSESGIAKITEDSKKSNEKKN